MDSSSLDDLKKSKKRSKILSTNKTKLVKKQFMDRKRMSKTLATSPANFEIKALNDNTIKDKQIDRILSFSGDDDDNDNDV